MTPNEYGDHERETLRVLAFLSLELPRDGEIRPLTVRQPVAADDWGPR